MRSTRKGLRFFDIILCPVRPTLSFVLFGDGGQRIVNCFGLVGDLALFNNLFFDR